VLWTEVAESMERCPVRQRLRRSWESSWPRTSFSGEGTPYSGRSEEVRRQEKVLMGEVSLQGSGGLEGKGVAVTRGEGEDGPLSRLLKERGARVLDWGSIAFAPPEDICPIWSAMARIAEYDWVCFSSPRAVEAVVARVPNPPEGLKVAAVGPSTAAALEKAGWPVHRVPTEGSGEGLVEAFRVAGDAGGASVFFPASAIAREVIPEGLRELGARVDRMTAYRMITLPLDGASCRASFDAGEVAAITFASPSAMEAFRAGVGEEFFGELARSIPAAVMGPTTARAVKEAGWSSLEVAGEPTLEGLVAAAEAALG
jgi:uroporphyrinogen-III synthase